MSCPRSAEILIVGAGPAGMAAAVRASDHHARVLVLDDNQSPGGQIWRKHRSHTHGQTAARWIRKFESRRIEAVSGAQVIAADAQARTLLVEQPGGAFPVEYRKLILATGARELFLPFPGWTLPNVMGVGGLQALVKSGLPVRGKRILVAGTGPLLLAAAAFFRKQGAIVPAIAEQSPGRRVAAFGLKLARYPAKLWQALRLRISLAGTRYLTDCWVEAAETRNGSILVRLRRRSATWTTECDYLAAAFGFTANTELAALLGCAIDRGVVRVDELQQTSIPGVYCAGEPTGIGGVDLSLTEGQIAGCAAASDTDAARHFVARRTRARRFAGALSQAFALREDLRSLATSETIVCRCEDVTLGAVRAASSWRAAKLHTRCGMGPCQGRICGPIAQFLFDWNPESIRPPLFPARVGSLLSHIEEGI